MGNLDEHLRCEDCDYIGENGCSLDVHHGKFHNIDFECGLCDYKGKDVEKLETHLSTCEAYLCCECNFRGRFISSIRTHMTKEHVQENVKKKLGLNWAKLKFSLVRVDDEVTVVFNSV